MIKREKFIVVIVVLYVFFVSNILIFKHMVDFRDYLQVEIVVLKESETKVLTKLLGEGYILMESDYLYTRPAPYFLTFFDAIFHWINMRDAERIRACANAPGFCSDTVLISRGDLELFNYLKDDTNGTYEPYCIAGVEGVGAYTATTNGTAQTFSFYNEVTKFHLILDTSTLGGFRGTCD
ncbi:hypothetical protein [Aliidiomarina celeris]|uniref:hypothetical protein n=1 Tax=Aliidiomarina celeris TaxID=2249428 RepID=UPI000DE98754|nr:hypothetical protein [Aliidiomarina celeris]